MTKDTVAMTGIIKRSKLVMVVKRALRAHLHEGVIPPVPALSFTNGDN
jgi:hypothetical protein